MLNRTKFYFLITQHYVQTNFLILVDAIWFSMVTLGALGLGLAKVYRGDLGPCKGSTNYRF